ncbi:MAG: hypothetical protein WD226_07855 [Planctomycetota bacterium]
MTRTDETVLLHDPWRSRVQELAERRLSAPRTRIYLEEPLDQRSLKALVVKLGLGAGEFQAGRRDLS